MISLYDVPKLFCQLVQQGNQYHCLTGPIIKAPLG